MWYKEIRLKKRKPKQKKSIALQTPPLDLKIIVLEVSVNLCQVCRLLPPTAVVSKCDSSLERFFLLEWPHGGRGTTQLFHRLIFLYYRVSRWVSVSEPFPRFHSPYLDGNVHQQLPLVSGCPPPVKDVRLLIQ